MALVPFEVKLDCQSRPWCTVKFELGHNEIGDADEPEYRLASDLAELFIEVGLEVPRPIPVMPADHQIAQKLHALSAAGSERHTTSSISRFSTQEKLWICR